MSREIKFRLWCVREQMFYEHGFSVDMDGYEWHDDNDKSYRLGEDYLLNQFTGLQSKLNQDLYEGDICTKMISPDEINLGPKELYRGVIVYHYGGFCLHVGDYYYPLSRQHGVIEVIGNFYQNPELIKA